MKQTTTLDSFGKVYYPNLKKDDIHGAKLFSINNEIYIEFDFPSFHVPNKPEIILGDFTGIGPITCMDNELFGLESGEGGTRCKYKVSYLFTGMHFTRKRDISFYAAIFHLNSLVEWFDVHTIKHSFMSLTGIEFGPSQKIDLKIKGFKSASFTFTHTYSSKRYSIEASEQMVLTLKSLSPKNIDHFYKIILKLKKLFAFLTNIKFEIDDISLYYSQKKLSAESKENSLVKVKLYDKKQEISPIPTSEFLNIKYIDIKENFPLVLTKWFRISEDNLVIDLLMEKAYNHELSEKTYFLNVCFALEIYHKNNISDQKLSTEEFEKIKDYLKKNVKDSQVKDWINSKLGLGNYPSFKDRLVYFKNAIGAIYHSEVETLIDKIIYIRNSLVHSSSKSGNRVIDEFELYVISITLETVLKGAILKDLGIDQKNIKKIYSEAKKHISHIIKRKDSEWLF